MPCPAIGALHRLAPSARGACPEEAARAVVALHATDPASVHLAVAARTAGAGASTADVDRALYDDRTIVRVLAMRRTLWAVPAGLVPVVVAACGLGVAAALRRTLVAAVEDQGLAADGALFVTRLEDEAVASLGRRGGALAREVAADVADLARTVRIGGASRWATDASLATRVLVLLTAQGRVTRTRPSGSWTSTRARYAPAPPFEPIPPEEARADLARAWLAAFGPAAALVPCLDPTTMGWKERSWYLGDLAAALFGNGNAGPAIWQSGRIVGGWAQRPTGEVATRVLVDVGADGRAVVEAEAARLQAWLDAAGAVVRPRFPTPLQQELSA